MLPSRACKKELADRFSPVSGVGLQLRAGKACYAARGVDPELPFGILADGVDEPARQAVALRVGGGNAVIQPDETAIPSADPQHLRSDFRAERGSLIAAQTRNIRRAEHSEAHAIEAHEPSGCGQPEIALMVLHHVVDRVLRQTLLRLPDRGDVLRRIGLCVDGSDQETGQQTRGKTTAMRCMPAGVPSFQFKAVRERRAQTW